MLKQVLHKVFSISLALIVLCSTLSFTVEKHYCGPFLIDIAIFKSAKDCGMSMLAETESGTKENKMSCCNDEVELLQGQDELKIASFDTLDLEQQLFLYTYQYTYNNLFKSLPKQIIPHKDYSPPNLIEDIHVMGQTFLI